MRLKVKILRFLAGRPVAVLNLRTANKINVHVDERIKIRNDHKSIISIVDTAAGLIKQDEILVSSEIVEELGIKKDDFVEVSLAQEPKSAILIHKKLECNPLQKTELNEIMRDIVNNALTETEIAYFVSAVFKCGMTPKETEYLVRAMVNAGQKIHFKEKSKRKVVDKHSIGGVAGNRTTPIIVSICAAAGLIMPKTSSRAITSAAGTADVIGSITNVEFSIKTLKKIIKKTNACMVWGGSLGLSPADDKLIQVERILHLDPEPQLLASVLSKKISVGSKYIIIDIPFGGSAKVNKERALELKRKFESLGKKFNLKLKGILTDGREPIGNAVGPLLEIRDILAILRRESKRPFDLEKKAVFLAGQIFELCGKSKKGQGEKLAKKILESGEAFKKFKQIIIAQHGKIPKKFNFGKFQYTIYSGKNFTIRAIDNKKINMLASLAGSPMDIGAGVYIFKHIGSRIKKHEPLLTIYSESKIRLKEAKDFYKESNPIC